jgi:hypothetical protein
MPENTRFGRGKTDQPFRPETSANDPREIVITPGWNVRDMTSQKTLDHIQELKASILARANKGMPGLIYAIKVKYDPATEVKTLVDGQCRLMACRELWDEGHKIYIPLERVKGTEAENFATSLAGNTGQENTQLEIGVGCKRLIAGFNWSLEMVAEHIGKKKRFITEALALTETPEEVQDLLSAGEVSAPAVRHEIKVAKEEHRPIESIVEPLKAAVAARPAPPTPAQASIPGTAKPVKQRPLARPKKESAREQALKAVPVAAAQPQEKPDFRNLAIDLARGVIADDRTFEEMERAAFRVLDAAGLKR